MLGQDIVCVDSAETDWILIKQGGGDRGRSIRKPTQSSPPDQGLGDMQC